MTMADGDNRGDSNAPPTQQSTGGDGDGSGNNNSSTKQQHHQWHSATVTPSIKYHCCNARVDGNRVMAQWQQLLMPKQVGQQQDCHSNRLDGNNIFMQWCGISVSCCHAASSDNNGNRRNPENQATDSQHKQINGASITAQWCWHCCSCFHAVSDSLGIMFKSNNQPVGHSNQKLWMA